MFLICHVTSRDHIFKVLRNFYGWILLTVSHYLAMFGGHWSSATGGTKHLICPVASQKHVTEQSCNFLSGGS